VFGDGLDGDSDRVSDVFLFDVWLASEDFEEDLELCGFALVS
jgi:hypothetical protein